MPTNENPGGNRGEQVTGQVREQEKNEPHTFPRQPLRTRMDQAACYLAALLGCSENDAWNRDVTWQVFDDTPAKDIKKARKLHGCLDDLAEELDGLNAKGIGVFVAIGQTDLKGREKKNITHARAAWADIDDKKAAETFKLSALALPPSMTVSSGHGTHPYWIFPAPIPYEGTKKQAEHEALLKGIQAVLKPYGADPQVCQVAGVLRVPGFYNCKREPVLVELLHTDGPRYSPKEVAKVYPPVSEEAKKGTKKAGPKVGGEPWILRIFRELGERISPAKDLGDGTGYRTGCPFGAEHTNGPDPDSGFLSVWPDGGPRHWNCRHEHCEHRTLADVLKLARERGLKVPERRKRPELPTILITPPETKVAEAAREAISALPGMYVRGGRLVHVHRYSGNEGKRTIPAGSVGIRDASQAWTRERLSEAAEWEKAVKKKGEDAIIYVPAMVPEWVPSMILEDPGTKLPELRAVVTVPVFLPDGSIHSASGQLKDGVLYLGPGDFPTVPDNPTERDAQAAWGRLKALTADFPWSRVPSQDAHRAAHLASLLSIVGRYAIEGPCPWILYEANAQASGKGLLAQSTAIITTGSGAPIMACPREEAELRKSILPVLMDGTRVQVLDEIFPGFGGREWNALVTATTFKGRILGTSQTVEPPADTVWIATGNNVGLASDTTRRCLPIRLEPMEERPEDRTGFKIPNLLGHVRKHQAHLLRDALTLLRAFHVAGRPASGLKPWGSFEGWSALIRDAVYWVTKADCDCRQALASVADMGRIIHADLIAELYFAFGNNPFTVGSVIEKTIIKADLRTAVEAACPSKEGKLKPVSVGKRFASFRRRPVTVKATAAEKGVLMFLDQEFKDDRQGGALWVVKNASAMPLQVNNDADDWRAIV